MTIRPYDKKDKSDVQHICLYSDGPEDISEGTVNFLLATYCDYYIENEPQNCFVAADSDNRAIGYVICAQSYEPFFECLKEKYISKIPKEETAYRFYAETSAVMQCKHKDEYPAHLHIDILPEYQRMGIGHTLIDTLCRHLKEKGVTGVMLSVSAINQKGISFYKKYGFTVLEELPDCVAFGLKL